MCGCICTSCVMNHFVWVGVNDGAAVYGWMAINQAPELESQSSFKGRVRQRGGVAAACVLQMLMSVSLAKWGLGYVAFLSSPTAWC